MTGKGWFGSAVILTLALMLSSCGDDDGEGGGDDSNIGESGQGGRAPAGNGGRSGAGALGGSGTGGSAATAPVACGSALCRPVTLPGYPGVAACCADEAESKCGLDTALLTSLGGEPTRSCEPLHQAGELDGDCPVSPSFQSGNFTLPPFSGCCNAATNTCGYMVDTVGGFIPIGLDCIESTPFLDGAEPAPCGPDGE